MRRHDAALPPMSCVDQQEISVDVESEDALWAEYAAATQLKAQLAKLAGRHLVFDLDDVLLPNNHSAPHHWRPLPSTISHAYLRRKLRTDWLRTIAARLVGRKYPWRANRQRHPFLNNHLALTCLRPGLLGALRAFRHSGAMLTMVSATGSQRLRYILNRWPALAAVFQEGSTCHAYAAEDIVVALDDLADEPTRAQQSKPMDWAESQKVHTRLGMSLKAKTPALIARLSLRPAYDLLIDDSSDTAAAFRDSPLETKLLWTLSGYPFSGYGLTVARAVLNHFSAGPASIRQQLACRSDDDAFWASHAVHHPLIVAEDPLYYPLIHITHLVPAAKGSCT